MSIQIRKAKNSDSKDIFFWRNDEFSLRMFKKSEIILWIDHCNWYKEKLKSEKNLFLIGEESNSKLGVVRFDIYDDYSEISINLNPVFRGKNLSKRFLAMGCNYYFNKFDKDIISEIKKINNISIKIFKSVGFKKIGSSQDLVNYKLKKKEFSFKV